MKKSKIASIQHDLSDHKDTLTKNTSKDLPKEFISYTNHIHRMNGTQPRREPPKPKTEAEQFEEILEKGPSVRKVRKFFQKYVDRINEEEDDQQEFKSFLATEL